MEKIPVRHLNNSPAVLDSSQNFSIRNIKDLLSGKDLVEKLHRHNFFHILILKRGKGLHEIDFVDYPVKEYTAFLVRPGQAHRLELNSESSGYMIKLNIPFYDTENKTFHQFLQKAARQNYYPLDGNQFKKILYVLDYIFDEYKHKSKNHLEIIKANLNIFFLELIRLQDKKVEDSASLYTQERLEEFLTLLETHIFSQKQTAAYAKMLNLTSYQLNAVTKTALNKTASEIITETIILESKRYLLATSNQVSQIADYMGYDDVSYFIRFFKKHTGFSPETFRKNFK